MQNAIAHALSSITVGVPLIFESITMLPLLRPRAAEREPSYLTWTMLLPRRGRR
jgi:hypothetical protein